MVLSPGRRVAEHPAGCLTMACTKRTARKPGRPWRFLGETRHGEPVNKLQRGRVSGRTRDPDKKKRPRRGRPKARGTGVSAEGRQGVGGPNMSEDGGERLAPGPTRAKEHSPKPLRRRRVVARLGGVAGCPCWYEP